MNQKKVSFVICTNNDIYYKECCLYIQQLIVPQGFETEIIPVTEASSMTQGYQSAMEKSDAKYKVYLHQDVLILNRNFLSDTLKLFDDNPKIGMLGMVGTKRLPDNGCMWSTSMRTGALRCCTLQTADDFFDIPIPSGRSFSPVDAVDGLLIMTQYDFPWRTDLFDGWDFYDVSQSLEFTGQGMRIAVPYQSSPWVLHDCGFMNLSKYHQYRKIFLEEYFPTHTAQIDDCVKRIKEKQSHTECFSSQKVLDDIFDALRHSQYDRACAIAKENLVRCQQNYTFCILSILLQIYEAECALGQPEIFIPLSSHEPEWLITHYLKIKLYLWRIENKLPDSYQQEGLLYFQENHVSSVCLSRFQDLVTLNL